MRELPPHLMRDLEADYLVDLVAGRVVLELGAFRGRTTARMAKVANRVWTVDNHHDSDIGFPYDSLHDYFIWLEGEQVRDKVVSIVGDFAHVLSALPYRYFDVVIVDGAHDAGSVDHDLTWALSLVTNRGTIAMHDWDLLAVAATGRRLLGEPTKLVDRLAIFEVSW